MSINRFITTEWRIHEENGNGRHISYLRVKYGFQHLQGNRRPYFSITAEEAQRAHGRRTDPVDDVPAPGKWEVVSCGCLHAAIAQTFPELAGLIKWHLVDDDGTPMHYLANGDYWMQKHLVVFRVFAHCEKEGRRLGEPEPLEVFKQTVVFGAVESDEVELAAVLATEAPKPSTIPELAELPEDRKAAAVLQAIKAWLPCRLATLRAHMVHEMDRAGIQFLTEKEVSAA